MKQKQKIDIKHKGLWIIALIIVVLACIGFYAAKVYFNYINIAEIGEKFITVYIRDIQVDIIIRSVYFVLAFILFTVSNVIIKKNLLKWEETATYLTSKFTFIGMPALLALLSTVFIPYYSAQSALFASNPTWFSTVDPIFYKDIGYYVFQRPFFVNITKAAIIMLALVLLYTLFVYLLFYIRNGGGGFSQILKQQRIVAHVAVCILLVFTATAFALNFYCEELLFVENGETVGGKYTDMTVWLNYFKLLPVFLFFIISAAITFIIKKKSKGVIISVAIYPALWILAVICAVAVQSFVVRPNEASLERQYIKNSIEYTTRAYGLDEITEIEYPVSGIISPESINQNMAELNNIPFVDPKSTLESFNQLHSVKGFYTFNDIDLIPYTDADGNRKTALVSVREMNEKNIPKDKSDYVSRTMKYTHGYGVVACSSSEVDADGNPIPLSSPFDITQNRIYFGELADEDNYVLVNTLESEIDYSDKETEFSYDGTAGVKLNPFTRILYAIRYADINIAISGYITDESKILTNRNIYDRLELAMPFLTFDEDASIAVTSDGRLVWVIDGYTTTNQYPYSQRDYTLDEDFGTNYVRNSVKVTVDAYNGNIEAYIIDWNDPIIQTYNKTYPGVFSSSPLPLDIASQITYPKTLFNIQSNIYKKYHNSNPSSFYSNADAWDFPSEKYGALNEVRSVGAYYSYAKAYDNTTQLMLMQPYIAVSKDSMTAWLNVSCEYGNYGKMTSYIFPQNKHVYGTMQIENKIDADPEIAKFVSSLKTDTTNVFRGKLLAVPVMDTVAYIEPIYTTSSNKSSVPELKKIILVCGDNVVLEDNIKNAFARLLLTSAPSAWYNAPAVSKPKTTISDNEVLSEMVNYYNEAKQFRNEGDWVNYGRTMEKFEQVLKQIETDLASPAEDLEEIAIPE